MLARSSGASQAFPVLSSSGHFVMSGAYWEGLYCTDCRV